MNNPTIPTTFKELEDDNIVLYYSLWNKYTDTMLETAHKLFPCLRNRKPDVGVVLGCADFLHHQCGWQTMSHFAKSMRALMMDMMKRDYPHLVFERIMVDEQRDNDLS